MMDIAYIQEPKVVTEFTVESRVLVMSGPINKVWYYTLKSVE